VARTRAAREEHLDPRTARLLDALIEGLSIGWALDRDLAKTAHIDEAIRRITPALAAESDPGHEGSGDLLSGPESNAGQ
jgi:hypothetical protein